jgi:oligopeptide/dipeptide ABC transporter ATP-binding protein
MVQDRILKEIRALQQKLNMTMLYISHDISVIAETCDDIAVMYAGNLVEYADKMSLFERPLHPYTKALMGAFPSIVGEKRALGCVPGEPPTLLNPPQGCRFRPRCPNATDRCKYAMPPLTQVEKRHWVACFQVW